MRNCRAARAVAAAAHTHVHACYASMATPGMRSIQLTFVCVCVCMCVYVQEMAESIRHRTHISSINDQGRALHYSCDFWSANFRPSMRPTVIPHVDDVCGVCAGATLTAPSRLLRIT